MLWIDHDHDTGTVRGLLCSDCNAAIFPFEFGSPIDDVTRRYLAEGDRQQRAASRLFSREPLQEGAWGHDRDPFVFAQG